MTEFDASAPWLRAIRNRADWLEDVIAGLMAAGVKQNEIEINDYPNGRTIVTVRGEPKYQWKLEVAEGMKQ